MPKPFLSIRDLCLISVFAAMIIALSPIPIPLPGGIPITLATFIIPFTGAVLGPKRGAIAALVYILLGAAGLPIFSSFRGGLGMLIGPTGGFLLTFPLLAWIVGFFAERNHRLWLAVGLVLGFVVNFSAGILYFSFVMQSSLHAAFMATTAPFLLVEPLKMCAVFLLAPTVRKALERSETR
ncbi:MAG: biotin transporter BioY [Oscillospiraceae bacterium]|nr:biotin transporter BioY [Oscillospiraceae bacterium]